MAKHATVILDGKHIPLIGIPESATEGECDLCHHIFHLTQLSLNEAGNQVLCPKCKGQHE